MGQTPHQVLLGQEHSLSRGAPTASALPQIEHQFCPGGHGNPLHPNQPTAVLQLSAGRSAADGGKAAAEACAARPLRCLNPRAALRRLGSEHGHLYPLNLPPKGSGFGTEQLPWGQLSGHPLHSGTTHAQHEGLGQLTAVGGAPGSLRRRYRPTAAGTGRRNP